MAVAVVMIVRLSIEVLLQRGVLQMLDFEPVSYTHLTLPTILLV